MTIDLLVRLRGKAKQRKWLIEQCSLHLYKRLPKQGTVYHPMSANNKPNWTGIQCHKEGKHREHILSKK